jgi:Adenylate and Guanylate cyclase catalytic domain
MVLPSLFTALFDVYYFLLLASRMESNGIRDKVQLSQSTADILMTAGKGHWIKPREELIEAKGKGSMQVRQSCFYHRSFYG